MNQDPVPQGPPLGPEDPTRRTFLARATCAIAACASAGVLAPAAAAVLSPLEGGIVKIGDGRVDLGPIGQFEDGVPRKVVVKGAPIDAFLKLGERSLGSVIVIRNGSAVVVFSATCPHAACDVVAEDRKLFCPCHQSAFANDGSVTAGPSPRGLDTLDAAVTNGRVSIRFERFRVGVPEKRPV